MPIVRFDSWQLKFKVPLCGGDEFTNTCSSILGAGITGLAAGMASRYPIFKAAEIPGGICASDYIRPDVGSGFQRVGFYSHIDISFLPKSAQWDKSRVSIYVERAYPSEARPSNEVIRRYCEDVTQ